MRNLDRYRELRRKGLCVDCHDPVGGPKARCEDCRKIEREKHAHLRREAIARGLCGLCRRSPAPKGERCEGCRARVATFPSAGRNATRERRAQKDQCRGCGAALVGDRFVRCAGCRRDQAEQEQARRDAMHAKGLCRCGKKLRGRTSRCAKCMKKRRTGEPKVAGKTGREEQIDG